jgi:hypothetical protein
MDQPLTSTLKLAEGIVDKARLPSLKITNLVRERSGGGIIPISNAYSLLFEYKNRGQILAHIYPSLDTVWYTLFRRSYQDRN